MRALALWMLLLLCKFGLAALPVKPENISCIFYYKKNLTCTWSPEKEAGYTWYRVNRTYRYGDASDYCMTSNFMSGNHASCSFFYPNVTNPDDNTIEVEAQNADGIIKSDVTHWNLDNIVKTEPPMIYRVKPVWGIKRMVQVTWKRPVLAPVSSTLQYTLRFRKVNSDQWMEVNFTREDTNENQTYNLTGLQDFTEYVLALRCAPEESRFWSDWSQEEMGTTEEQAPCGLDLWRVLGPAEANGRRTVLLLWKEAKGAPVLGKTLGYNIRYFPENNTNLTEIMNTTNQQLEVHLGSDSYSVSVISYNSVGKSPEATMRIPAIREESFQCIEAMQAHLTQGLLVVEWQSCPLEVDTWMVEWLPDLNSERSAFSWESVSQARNWTVQQDKFKPFWCYNISVYPISRDRVGEPYSIQIYVKEGIPSAGPVTRAENIGVKTVTIAWEEIPKSQRNGFISNYTIFYQTEDGEEFSKTVNSSVLRYDVGSLRRNTAYSVQLMASTSAGGANGTRINFKSLSISAVEMSLIISLVGGTLLVLVILMMAYSLKNPNKLKHQCWPDIPNPAESSIAMWRGNDFKNHISIEKSENEDADSSFLCLG
ncbi:interleukin-31 receptor subunit alpha [Choloepus didactylus]|uniref:interleukin-31 receptor subunit alpha n=1 Tax=Choloepus didactylus TaxID=27675 RepID=UPI00189FF437|nr:interleukin-31 receptor subunit alpha [Choloepus didactylus]